MEGNDLIQFESPTGQVKPSGTFSSESPGSNPFDSFHNLSESFFSKADKDILNLSDFIASGKQSLGILTGFEEGRPSLFKNFEEGRSIVIDVEGNPSLGILKDFEEGRSSLFKDSEERKPSLGILKEFEEGKASLGILKGFEEGRLSLFKDLEEGKPSLGILKEFEEGKPSLGILKDFEGGPSLFKDLEEGKSLGILKSLEEEKPSLGFLKDFEEGRPSLFKTLEEAKSSLAIFKDFEEGKPSLGILKDFEEGRPSLFKDLEEGKSSLAIFKDFEEGKPSLGILKDFEEGRPSLFKDLEEGKSSLAIFKDFEEGKPSLGFLKEFEEGRPSLLFKESDITERESLGVLKIDALNSSFIDNNVPEISITRLNTIEEQSEPSVGLNTAFLCPANNLKNSILSNTASPTPSPSLFNSGSLDGSELSKIYSVNSTKTFDFSSVSALNNAFILSKTADAFKKRISSLPEINSEPNVELKRCLSEKSENVDHNRDEAFNDSVFIEANHLADKIADGSVLEDYSFEANVLDSTAPPSFKEIEELESEKCSTEVVFKTIDKMLPVQEPSVKLDNKDNCEPKHSTQITTESATTSHRSSSSGESRKSRDPTELLHDLSFILQESKDVKQKHQGQQLLNSLANILCSSTTFSNENLEDSGHSSIETDEPNQEPACFEVLDLRKKNRSEDKEHVLDLSMKCKRLSQSFSVPSKLPPVMSLKGVRLRSTSSLDSKDHPKLKPKKIEGKNASGRKGPLKAVIPLSKCFSSTKTPPKTENIQSGLLRLKRTSTPIAESQLKPVAQSTPDGALNQSQTNLGSSQLQKRKVSYPISPLARPNNTPGDSSKSGQSISTPNLSSRSESSIPTPKTMLRRHSATELKQNESKYKMKRTGSIGKDFKTVNVQSKVKNTSSSSRISLREHSINSQKESPKSAPLHSRNFSIKPLGLLGRFKKGKENKN